MLAVYKAYTARWYHFLVWLCYPVAVLICCASLQTGFFGLHERFAYVYSVPQSVMGMGLCVAEILLDAFCLGGICSKDYSYRELFKVSPRGRKLYRGILVMDILRRAMQFALVYAGNLVIGLCLGQRPEPGEIYGTICSALWTYILCTLTILCTRYAAHLVVTLVTAYIFLMLGLVLQAVLVWCDITGPVALAAFAGGSILLSLLLIRQPIKKMEESYYDKK